MQDLNPEVQPSVDYGTGLRPPPHQYLWAYPDLNGKPLRCRRSALTIELYAQNWWGVSKPLSYSPKICALDSVRTVGHLVDEIELGCPGWYLNPHALSSTAPQAVMYTNSITWAE